MSPFQLIDARATMALYRLHKKEWEASKQGISTKTSPSISCSFTRCSLVLTRRFTCTGARKEPAASSDHTNPRRVSSSIVTAVTKVANGKAVKKEVATTSGKAIVTTVKRSANVKVASGETKIKNVERKHGTKESWWQNLE